MSEQTKKYFRKGNLIMSEHKIDAQDQIRASKIQTTQNAMATYSWAGDTLYSAPSHTIDKSNRMYVNFTMPILPRNPRIKKAELTFFQQDGLMACDLHSKLGVYQVKGAMQPGAVPPEAEARLLDYAQVIGGNIGEDGNVISYTFDITELIDQVLGGECRRLWYHEIRF